MHHITLPAGISVDSSNGTINKLMFHCFPQSMENLSFFRDVKNLKSADLRMIKHGDINWVGQFVTTIHSDVFFVANI